MCEFRHAIEIDATAGALPDPALLLVFRSDRGQAVNDRKLAADGLMSARREARLSLVDYAG